MRTRIVAAIAAASAFWSTGAMAQDIGAAIVADGFTAPVFVTAPGGDDRLFIVDQPGRIWIVENGTMRSEPFLDIEDQVAFAGELGLLGLAFHPDFAGNGRFFVNFTDRELVTRIVEYRVSVDADTADPQSARPILSFQQPAGNHNGGWIGFGPDGYLYIATGDGGRANDAFDTGQDPDNLLAKILRLDIDNGDPYAIPPGNPWANGGGAPEAYFWGLRNPWRASFDGENIYIGDVGQGEWEEIDVANIADAGANFGWSIMEGMHCFQAARCDQAGLVLPVIEYSHATGCSVTGGYVYRGDAIQDLNGLYFYADYCQGFVASFRYVEGTATEQRQWPDLGNVGRITSFGLDSDGELYITSANGRVYKIVPR